MLVCASFVWLVCWSGFRGYVVVVALCVLFFVLRLFVVVVVVNVSSVCYMCLCMLHVLGFVLFPCISLVCWFGFRD